MKQFTNLSEQDVLDTIELVVQRIAPSFKFGYLGLDDIKQQARLIALEGLDSYDETRPLINFLMTHVKNRLINFKRDKYKRTDTPCRQCYDADSCFTLSPCGKHFCEKYIAWKKRNLSKQNIMNTLDISNINDEKERNAKTESSVLNDAIVKELEILVRSKLEGEFLADYILILDGVKLNKKKKIALELEIKRILYESN